MKNTFDGFSFRSLALALLVGAAPLPAKSVDSVNLSAMVTEPGFWALKGDAALAKFPAKSMAFFPKNQTSLAQSGKVNQSVQFGTLTLYSPSMDLATNAVLRVSANLLGPQDINRVTNENAKTKVEEVLKELEVWAGRKSTPLSGPSRGKEVKLRYHVVSKGDVGVVFTSAMREVKARDRGQKDTTYLVGAYLDILPVRPGSVDPRALVARNQAVGLSRPVLPLKNKEGDMVIANLRPGLLVPPGATPGAIAVERAMRTMGVQIDPSDLPQLNGAGDGPVNVARDLSSLLKYRFVDEIAEDAESFDKLRRDYNLLAKKSGAPIVDDVLRLNVSGQLGLMDAETLRQARGTKNNEVGGFRRAVQKHVTKGIPVLWVMCDGMIGDNPGVRREVSVMLMVGQNTAKDELLYIHPGDPEGKIRRMSFADGWSVTLRVSAIIR